LDGVIGVSHRGKTPPAMKGQSGLGKSRDTPMGFVTIRKEPFDDADVDFEFRCDACQWSSTEVMDLALGAHISRGTGRVEARIRALGAELENRLTTQAWALREWRWRIDVPDLASTARRAASVTTGRMPPISGKLSGEGRCKELDTGGRCNGLFRGTAVNTPWINTPCFTLAIDGTPDDLRHPFRGTLTMRQARLPNRGTLLQLQRPATLRFGRHDVVIEHFDVSMAGGQIALRGGLSRKGENHLTATVRHLELGQLAQMTPGGDLGGDLNAKATVTGSGESVESALSLKVKGLRYRATDFGDLTLDATYRSRALSLVLDADGELAKRLRSSGRLLMSILAFPYGKVTVAPESNRIRLKADGLPLGRLLPLFSTPLG
jgi:hypothetical protein